MTHPQEQGRSSSSRVLVLLTPSSRPVKQDSLSPVCFLSGLEKREAENLLHKVGWLEGESLRPLASVSLYGKGTKSPGLVLLFTVAPEPLPLLAFGLYYSCSTL